MAPEIRSGAIALLVVEQELLNRCIAADRKAQSHLYALLYPQLMSICRRYQQNELDARGLLNQGFLKILLNLKKKKDHVPFIPWCRRILINTIISEHRKNSKRVEMEKTADTISPSKEPFSWNDVETLIQVEALQAMLDQVPDISRKVFNLFAIDGYSHKEIAELLGISTGTSKWHVSHARALLKVSIEQFMQTAAIKVDQ